MNPKQLANVLVKILGLSVGVHAIPGVINGIVMIFQLAAMSRYGSTWQAIFYPLGSFITIGVGVLLIVRSRWVVEKIFADEAE